ncbi:UNVERIFIED_CONTAM: S-type anion channel SLAH1 [Sesamum radiatum]|uniref:S-type anion channel SLAH1 n=1 Tax=Sesamum radiatum TaxID=300843 RepID=A0AAW2M5M9_SESRA
MVVFSSHTHPPLASLLPQMHLPVQHDKGGVHAPRRGELPVCPLDLLAPDPRIRAVRHPKARFFRDPVVDFRDSGYNTGREDLRPVVHQGKRFLTAVANPASQLSVVGNLVGARAAAKMEWREVSVFLFSLGMVHYLVLFVTLYQRLSGGDRLPAMLRPVFFLFFAAPSVASLAWYSISGSFDTPSKMLFFLSLFLFASLICRPALFRKAMRRFNIAWWAYSYPITLLALASARYEEEVQGGVSRAIRLLLSGLSVLVLLGLLLLTAFNPKLLLPDNDPILLTTLPPTSSNSHSPPTAPTG